MPRRASASREIEERSKALERLVVEWVPTLSLVPNDYNPNRQSDHDFELLCRSIREDGFTQPVIAQRSDRVIVDGEHRWRAAQVLGYDEVPAVFVEMTVEQMRVATLRHNRARGSEDIELAAAVLRDLDKLGALSHAQDSLMLDDLELARLLEDVAEPELPTGWADAVVPGAEAGVASGDGVTGMSIAAVEAARRREAELRQAKTAEERQRASAEAARMFRLVLVFEGAEAEMVRHVLGSRPADKLVAVARWWRERHPGAAA